MQPSIDALITHVESLSCEPGGGTCYHQPGLAAEEEQTGTESTDSTAPLPIDGPSDSSDVVVVGP
jgi:hypothetical protein